MKVRFIIIGLVMLLAATAVRAQITIAGNVYGGGNAGDTGGNTKVTVHAGDLNCVYGGARQADVGGHAFVNVDGEHMSADIVINYVYGGNDIAGTVGESVKETDPIPTELTDAAANGITPAEKYSAFVLTTKERTAGTGETQRHIFIGQLFGGGNGDYDYTSTSSPYMGMIKPELSKTYLELRGGTIAYAYGGGNNATVTVATDICVNNSSSVTTDEHLKTILNIDDNGIKARMKEMGLNTVSTQVGSNDFQFARVFGGNNKAEMAIQPTWHLKDGKIRNLYSGGNQGAMTHKEGLLLEIQANSSIVVDNVFGGCRMAAVRPLASGTLESGTFIESSPSDIQLQGYNFPAGLSARVLVRGGDINNVYGGNDISGDVTGGNAVDIYASVRGDVYGGGNGSYAYTDNEALKDNDEYRDFYYYPGSSSVDALNAFRPNAEAVSIRVMGTEAKPTIIGGAIYCGGNSATLRNDNPNQDAASELKIGSYVIADKVFLGNNGANMVTEDILKLYAGNVALQDDEGVDHDYDFSQMNLASEPDANGETQFEKYMDGCAMKIKPRVVFDADYVPYSTMFGSFYCGGNVGSMKVDGTMEVSFNDKVVIYDKVVGGSNMANVYKTDYNAQYLGGLLGDPDANGNKLILNFGGLKIQPKRWVDENDKSKGLEWNTVDSRTFNPETKTYTAMSSVDKGGDITYDSDKDPYRRFHGGNIYGGCYSNGHVNGNVVINLNASLVDRKGDNAIFDVVEENEGEAKLYAGNYNITYRNTGVLIGEQGMDPLGRALNVFGGGYGADSEIWGSATINLNAGYTFQIFGGGEMGAIGMKNEEGKYTHDEKYSTYINLKDKNGHPGTFRGDNGEQIEGVRDYDDMAEAEFIYGGSFEGLIAGDTHINLGNGRIFNSFAGSCNADILGHTETYVGRNSNNDNDLGFPWIRDHIYGGNDLGGRILGQKDFTERVRSDIKDKVYNPKRKQEPDVLKASAYTEFIQGRVEYIFGGCYGDYDYTDPHYKNYSYTTDSRDKTDANLGTMRPDYHKPWMDNAFVNFKPNSTPRNAVTRIYGAGQGHAFNHASDTERDMMQDRSYILIDAPQSMKNFTAMEVFGAGDYSGVGMRNEDATTSTSGETTVEIVPALKPEKAEENANGVTASTVIDLMRGDFKTVYGGSNKEGVTRRTLVNVPAGSTIAVNSIFGGAYGIDTYHPCDVYEANVNWRSENASVSKAIYGGNNNERRTIYGRVNVYAPVYSGATSADGTVKYTSTVYGAGCGKNTWSEYTEVNLEEGASVYEVYGGGEAGKVYNAESVQRFMNAYKPEHWPKKEDSDPIVDFTDTDWKYAWTLGGGYDPAEFVFSSNSTSYMANPLTNLSNSLVREAEMDDRTTKTYKYNTNVLIKKGATVGGYAYGGGLGEDAVVAGTTYIALLGGKVSKDLYAAGTSGSVEDLHGAHNFTASANAYIEGGSARNVYGGGWKGSVGHHVGDVDADYYNPSTGELIDIPGETHVVIGILKDELAKAPEGDAHYHLYHGIPYVERNAYGGGEGGAVWGTANITLNNGYIGYVYNKNGADKANTANIDERYEEKIEDDTYKDEDGHYQENKRLDDAGCIFGGGYIDNSSVDFTHVTMYGGHVRNALFGGGEIAAIGRGKIQETAVDGKAVRSLEGIYRPGRTVIEMFDGYVHRNVFGGGRGYNNLGDHGKLFSDGYVFGQTEVHIHGGEIGTEKELLAGNGNVFGGGDIGYVYSAYEYTDAAGHRLPRKGVKDGVRYDGDGMYQGYQGYYYEHDWANNGSFVKYQNGVENSSGDERKLTEDCKVLIEPHCKVKADNVSYTIKYSKGQIVSENDLEYLQSIGSNLLTSGIDAYGKVTATDGISFTRSFNKGDYVPTSALNTLGNKDDNNWQDLEANTNDDGIIIYNAVFAGGNTSSKGSDEESSFANSISVYGNATASIHDVYHRDLITIGTGHIGGLYGDGNLTLVDGYRGLNITNYGTDYNYLYEEQNKQELTIQQYEALLDREKDYYELRYKCKLTCTDDDGTVYYPKDDNHTTASTLTADDILTLFAKQNGENGTVNMFATDTNGNKIPNPVYWEQNGVCSIYAGRILNTLQRADFCGVFGSRLVMQGAQDRVPEVVDYTKYTINRVREVSLNKKLSIIPADANNAKRKMHGNYFGIYSVVNYLGALTSDFDFGDQGTNSDTDDAVGRNTEDQPYTGDVGFGDIRTSDNINSGTYGPQYEGQTFYGWKRFHKNDRDRNNGNSHNKVALASGVYLELTTEESTGKDLYEKVWGPITGVVELDLINVQQGIGGGFVYAKNIHGVRSKTNRTNTTLTALNAGAVTRWDYTYAEPSTTSNAADPKQREWQTSGNFVHSTQTIIDDCYNVSSRYMGSDRVPAHYWYIKGSVYVYDQYISAYTGATNAYSEMVDIPLTITAASHGSMKLLNVQPNRYAYYNTNMSKLTGEQKLVINDVEYTLNTPISYWDWYKLTTAEQKLFVPETYVSVAKYKYSQNATDEFPAEQVLLPEDYTAIVNNAHKEPVLDGNGEQLYDGNNNPMYEAQLWDVENEKYVPVESVIRMSNNLSHDTGYILTYKVNNPTEWNSWYTEYFDTSNTSAIREKKQDKTHLVTETDASLSQKGPNEGPTYRLKSGTGEWLGQRNYKVSEIISDDVVTTYNQAIATSPIADTETQATFVRAYVATAQTEIQRNGQTTRLYKGSTLSATEASEVSNVAEALVCTKTIRLSSTDNLYINSVMTADERDGHLTTVNSEIGTLVAEINTVLAESSITPIATDISEISSLTVAQLNKITALQKKELSDLLTRKKEITNNIVPAYYCTKAGLYGGDYYAGGINYRGLEAWSSMSEEDRAKFDFNYDALDLLIDPHFSKGEGEKYQYDSAAGTLVKAQANPAGYSLEKPVDYTATYTGEEITLPDGVTVTTLNSNTPKNTLRSGDELSRAVYESLPNEQRHYTPLTVTSSDVEGSKTCTFYVVNTPLMIGSTPYTTGNVISEEDYEGLPNQTEKNKVTKCDFNASGTYYFCREAYANVNVGDVINSPTYEDLPNYQKGFTIHGIAPTETSTLYVSRFSDIDDLSTEKIITVIYEYDYEESDVSGMHITPVTERHVLNIHLQFKTGAPIVEDISAPPIVLPGDILSLVPPTVIEGASPIQGGGWELYSSENDADNHNGVDYIPDIDPLYWYQNGYWLRYYALSYVGGKTYSNKVQVSVANYHDLKKVMEDKAHHYFVDIPDLNRLRESKIYINDAENGVQQLKDLFDLSLLTTAPTSGRLSGHSLFDPQVRACGNLEFIMRTNVNHTGTWESIGGTDQPCFEGILHGDGHYISGLSESLFGKLCGEVYNLGVMGSFTSAGIADTGDGYVENCWVKSSATSGWADGVQAVFGKPNRVEYTAVADGTKLTAGEKYYTTSTGGGEFTATGNEQSNGSNYYIKRSIVQLVNCYYPVGNEYKVKENADRGAATQMPVRAFYNGEVAYDLNGFYLYKRYRDHSGQTSTDSYKYFTIEDLAETTPTPSEASYGTSDTKLSSSGAGVWNKGYVEDRYADGDFRYAGGVIPEANDERLYIDTEDGGRTKFYPIWPDDYLFFGQMLNYGWNESILHEEVPSPIVKSSGRLLNTDQNNRVYRAPAYYRSKDMGVVHYNPWAYLAAYSAPKTITDTNLKPAYPNMTAVDFAGHYGANSAYGTYAVGLVDGIRQFYPPLLDDDGLIGVANRGETPNLLVYAPAETAESGYANMKTYGVLNAYFIGSGTNRSEPVYNEHTESSDVYGRVAVASTSSITGHLVQSNLMTTTDHLLVDKRDFNCPVAYVMGSGYRMWYQRTPDKFVDRTKGWESVSLPFTTEIVTTQDKGELTHFYQGSTAGHEYWLREYAGNVKQKMDADNQPVTGVFTADFNPLAAGSNEKDYSNTFLWDYYYSKDTYKDYNTDEYQKQYYSSAYLSELYPVSNYPYSQGGTPYLVGFPGSTYYEFDLSGIWTPDHRYRNVTIPSPGKQTVTFASVKGAPIGVSDDETGVTANGLTFKPTYLNNPDTGNEIVYQLDNDGDSFDKTAANAVAITAFRPYFIGAPSSTRAVEQIIFGQADTSFDAEEEHGDPRDGLDGSLNIYAKKGKIIVESSLNHTVDVGIFTPAGLMINTFTVKAGETVEQKVNASGIYIVQPSDRQYTKKLMVKK